MADDNNKPTIDFDSYRYGKDITVAHARAIEKNKTRQQKREDIAYTVNHAIICTLSDFIDPVIGNYTQKWFNRGLTLGHGDHSHEGLEGLKLWFFGEFVGDAVAVPVTIGVQRIFPGAMHWINRGAERALGPLFKDGARNAAISWAYENNLPTNDAQVIEKAKEYYDNEVSHLGQTAVWTAAAYAGNVIFQKTVPKWTGLRNEGKWWELVAAKGVGSVVTAGLVVGVRSNATKTAEKYDAVLNQYVVNPVLNRTNKWLGLDKESAERVKNKVAHGHGGHTEEAVSADSPATSLPPEAEKDMPKTQEGPTAPATTIEGGEGVLAEALAHKAGTSLSA
jgi:hypothetical protein